MIVSCPSCQTKYNLPDDKVPEGGLKVKCSNCAHVFKVTPPPATPEEEVEVLLDESLSTDQPAPQDDSMDFDEAFDEAMAEGGADLPDDDMNDDMDDLLADDSGPDQTAMGDSDDDLADLLDDDQPAPKTADEPFDGDEASGGDAFTDESLFTDDDDDDLGFDLEDDDDDPMTSLMEDDDDLGDDKDADDDGPAGFPAFADDDDDDDDFGVVDDDDDDDDGPRGFDLDDDDDDDERFKDKNGLFDSLGEDLDFESGKKRKKKRGGFFGFFFLLLILGLFAAIFTYNLSMWSLPDDLAKKYSIEVPFELPFKVPFLKNADAPEPPEPGTPPFQPVEKIEPKDFRQYVVRNEKTGPVFVVEGKAQNNFEMPKGRIKIQADLLDEAGTVLATTEQMCGNTLSLFQLQVQSETEIMAALNSKAGIYANNSYIKPGESTPFMVVFFNPPEGVSMYQVTILDARDPEQQ